MGPRGCVAYTPTIALRQLKWTQVVPHSEELGGLSFQYVSGDVNGQQEKVRAAWENVRRKGETELGKPRVTASSEYKDWRHTRGVPMEIPKEAPHGEALSHESSQVLASLTSQVEAMKAQMRLMEEREEAARAEIEVLKRKCQKKDREIEHLKDECANDHINSVHAKRAKKGQEKETETTLIKEMQDKIEAMEKEMTKTQKEKEVVEKNGREQQQRIERMQEDLHETRIEADKWWNLARDYFDSLFKANQNEERLSQQIAELTLERDKLRSDVEGSQLVVEHHLEKKKEMMKTFEDMTECVQNHATNLATHVREANEEIESNPGMKLPWRIFKLLKYCQNLSKSFM